RFVLLSVGSMMTLVALFADQLGLDHSPRFGTGEIVLLVVGMVLLVVGWVGRRVFNLYRMTAILVLNTLVLLILLELAATVILTVGTLPVAKSLVAQLTGQPNDLVEYYHTLPYYAEQIWSTQYWQEHKLALKKKYHPYVVWRSPPFAGELLNIDQNGIRQTPGTRCKSDTYRIFLFGGSTMWGWGAPDWGTIPAYLQAELQADHPESVCVVNFGEQAYVSTQSLVQLMLLLEAGEVPDMVIFYDGVNEVFAASQTGRPIIHQNFSETAAIFEESQPSFLRGLQALNSFTLFQMVVAQLNIAQAGTEELSPNDVNTDQLAEAVVQAYLTNYKNVAALAESYGFDYYFFWQPYILTGDKPLTDQEQAMITGLNWVFVLDEKTGDLFATTYSNVELEAENFANLYSLAHAFDQTETQVWIDTWGHVTPVGNRLIAQQMVDIIELAGR
ncbi:MAG: SGNH/GDSL hydrolase family protein, partial [Anaerolineae bacterium]|nr:SGNH/GDSL hydrolase family protein [Anaerolineae bacterium]